MSQPSLRSTSRNGGAQCRPSSDDAQPYQYLVESIRQFPEPDRFAEMIREAGFANVTHRPMTGGLVRLHSGWSI